MKCFASNLETGVSTFINGLMLGDGIPRSLPHQLSVILSGSPALSVLGNTTTPNKYI